ncbi:hypothetical protein Hanom_Chr00s154615g01823161 [Helianthus anomalus]
MAFRKVSLFMCIRLNHSTKWTLSSGCVSSRALRPVISSISITPKLNTSILVVTRPVTSHM